MTARLSPQREGEIAARWEHIPTEEQPRIAVTNSSRGGLLLNALGHARTDVPALLAELAAVRAERDEARERVDEVERRYTFDTADLRRSVDHHEGGKERWRKRAREAEAMVRELKRPAELERRAETRSSFTALMAEAEQAKDHEGAASLAQELAKVEAKWQREDEEATS